MFHVEYVFPSIMSYRYLISGFFSFLPSIPSHHPHLFSNSINFFIWSILKWNLLYFELGLFTISPFRTQEFSPEDTDYKALHARAHHSGISAVTSTFTVLLKAPATVSNFGRLPQEMQLGGMFYVFSINTILISSVSGLGYGAFFFSDWTGTFLKVPASSIFWKSILLLGDIHGRKKQSPPPPKSLILLIQNLIKITDLPDT